MDPASRPHTQREDELSALAEAAIEDLIERFALRVNGGNRFSVTDINNACEYVLNAIEHQRNALTVLLNNPHDPAR